MVPARSAAEAAAHAGSATPRIAVAAVKGRKRMQGRPGLRGSARLDLADRTSVGSPTAHEGWKWTPGWRLRRLRGCGLADLGYERPRGRGDKRPAPAQEHRFPDGHTLRRGPRYLHGRAGNPPRQLTRPPAGGADFHPSWSPHGTQVVFERLFSAGKENEASDIYTIAVRSGAPKRLTNCTGTCLGVDEPDWSPDGRRVAFFRAEGPLDANGNAAFVAIFTIRPNGSHLRQVTQRHGGVGAEDHFPTWSPDGKWLAFERIDFKSGKARSVRIFIVRADGGKAHAIDLPAGVRPGPDEISWSPNGKRLLFSTYCTFESACSRTQLRDSELFSVSVGGGGLRQLTHTPGRGNSFSGGWSPNGRRIVFARHAGGPTPFTADLYTIAADGGDLHRLTRTQNRYPHHPDWGGPPG